MEPSFPENTGTSTGGMARSARNGESMIDRLAQSAHAAVDRMAETAGPALERMRDTAGSTADSLRSRVGDMGERQSRAVDSMRDYVREKPVTSLALAVLAGMVISRMMR
jgi:ElaB/YqjD/DUF883 family membrane-anchored ribosome-binding protein